MIKFSSFMWISEVLAKWHVNQFTICSQAKVTIMPFLDEWVCLLWPMCTLWCFNQPLKWYPHSLYSLLFRPFWWRGGMQQCLQWKKVAQRLGALKNKSASISLYCIFSFWYANCPPQPSLKTFHQFFFFFLSQIFGIKMCIYNRWTKIYLLSLTPRPAVQEYIYDTL